MSDVDGNVITYRVMPSDEPDWIVIETVGKKIKVDVERRIFFFRYDCKPHNVRVGSDSVPCSRFCCYSGCYVTEAEIRIVENMLDGIKKYMSAEGLRVLKKYNDVFYNPDDYCSDEGVYKIRCSPRDIIYHEDGGDDEDDSEEEGGKIADKIGIKRTNIRSNKGGYGDVSERLRMIGALCVRMNPSGPTFMFRVDKKSVKEDLKNSENEGDYSFPDNIPTEYDLESEIDSVPPTRCIFLMDNGLCAVHKFCAENNIDWRLSKFNICTTFPLDIRVTRNSTAADAPYPPEKRVDDDLSIVKMMYGYEDFTYVPMNCINLEPKIKERSGMPYILDSLKYAIETRLGKEFWWILRDFAVRWKEHGGPDRYPEWPFDMWRDVGDRK